MLAIASSETCVCRHCQRELPIDQFHRNKLGANGRRSKCKRCSTTETREWRRRLPMESRRAKRLRHQQINPKSYFWSHAKRLAKNAGVPFDLAKDDIELPTHCPLLEIELVYFATGEKVDGSASVDRIFADRGYVAGNVRIISDLANRMKNSATAEQIKRLASNIDAYVCGSRCGAGDAQPEKSR